MKFSNTTSSLDKDTMNELQNNQTSTLITEDDGELNSTYSAWGKETLDLVSAFKFPLRHCFQLKHRKTVW